MRASATFCIFLHETLVRNHNDIEVMSSRATKGCRKGLLAQIVSFMYNGEVAKELEANVLRKKRFSTVKLARVSDMNSSFNPSALGAIASCEGGKAKGEVGLLCGESTLRRCMDKVLILAQKLGFYYLPPEHGGSIWCWGDATGLVRGAINRYVKTIYHDACCDTVTKDAPWIVPLTGDGVVTSKRGAYVTVLGAKLADGRLVQQEQTGKTMNQSSAMYTPIVAILPTHAQQMSRTEIMKIICNSICSTTMRPQEPVSFVLVRLKKIDVLGCVVPGYC